MGALRSSPLRSGDASELHMHLQSLASLLGKFNYRYGSEVQLHDRLEWVLSHAGHAFAREFVLDAKNRADFRLDSGLVIEVKVDGSLSEALRQVDRYIHLPQVTGVLLASTARWADQQLVDRPAWGGKPFHLVRLQRQTL